MKCEHRMFICQKCEARFCKLECERWVEFGEINYVLANIIHKSINTPNYSEIIQKDLCQYCK